MKGVLTTEIDDQGVAWLGLNRPSVHNAFDLALMQALSDALKCLAGDDRVRLAVLYGHGKSFCAGGDLNWMRSMKEYSFEENIADSQVLADMFTALYRFPKPLIGVVHGAALGGGCGLVALCDYVLSSDSARFGFTETRLGLLPAVISPFVIQKIGVSAARAHFISGALFDAQEALRIGLVHEIAAEDALEAARDAAIARFLQAAPNASVQAKALIHALQAFDEPTKARDLTVQTIAKARLSAEAQEGMAALLDKTTPSWREA